MTTQDSQLSECDACTAWAGDNLARGPDAWAAQRGITAVGLQEAIRRAWPEDYAAGRALVWDWMGKVGVRK
jgi:hypothetical protein